MLTTRACRLHRLGQEIERKGGTKEKGGRGFVAVFVFLWEGREGAAEAERYPVCRLASHSAEGRPDHKAGGCKSGVITDITSLEYRD